MTEEFSPVVCCDGLYPFPVWFQQVYYRLGRLICIFAMGQFSHDLPVCASVYYSHDSSLVIVEGLNPIAAAISFWDISFCSIK